MTSSITKAEFWQNHERFLKDNLTTEMPNPKTHNLSQLCHSDIDQAFTLFKQIELDSINALKKYLPDIKRLQQNISTNAVCASYKQYCITQETKSSWDSCSPLSLKY